MVYETDFYTTRRPYSRPSLSSYSVTTPLRWIPGVSRMYSYSPYTGYPYYGYPYSGYSPYSGYTYPGYRYPYLYHHSIPHYSSYSSLPGSLYLPSAVPLRYYTRSSGVRVIRSPLEDYSPPSIFSVHVRPSVIHRELLRIEHKPRPSYGYSPLEEYLNSPSNKEFEDDIRSIRTQTSRVLQRIHAPIPRTRRALSCSPFTSYGYDSAEREREFFNHIRGKSLARDDIYTLSNYAEPLRYSGKSHLASVRICGDKGYPIRKYAYTDDIYDPVKVHNEIEYLSHYLKNRRAAADKENKAPKLESARSNKIVENGHDAIEAPASG